MGTSRRKLPAEAFSIVSATPQDVVLIHELQMRAFAEEGRLSKSMAIPPLLETPNAIEMLIRTQTVLLAQADGKIVGSARGIRAGSVCTIRAVMVEPSWQGQGVGGRLLQAVEQVHDDVNCFELTTNTLVPGNVAFYQRHGYHVYEQTPYGDKIVLAQMRKWTGRPATTSISD